MKFRKTQRVIVPLLAAASLAGCYGSLEQEEGTSSYEDADEGAVSQTQEGLVSASAAPPVTVTTANALPGLPNGPSTQNTAVGYLATGDYLNVAPTALAAEGAASDPWVTSVAGDPYVAPPAMAVQVKEAIKGARAALKPRIAEWNAAMDKVKTMASLAGAAPVITTAKEQSFAYAPERGRWFDLRKTATGTGPTNQTVAFNELRERGARLYCSAKQAYANGGNTSHVMGRKSMATINVLGSKIDLMSIEPTIALSSPKKYMSSSNDGAQAFLLPMTAGVRVSPLSFLPSLPELRTPVAYVTADSANAIRVNATANNTNYEQWRTATHADALLSATQSATIIMPPIPLFAAGPVMISLKAELGLGSAPCSQAADLKSCQSTPRQKVKRLLLNPPSTAYPAARSGDVTTAALAPTLRTDAAWTLLGGSVFAGHNLSGYGDLPENEYVKVPLQGHEPMLMRGLQDNDKSLEVRTNASLKATISGGARIPLTPFIFDVSASGGLASDVSVVHAFREQEEAVTHSVQILEDDVVDWGWQPTTSLSVTPNTEASLNGTIDVGMTITANLPWPIGSFAINVPLVDLDAPLVTTKSARWPEANRLRIGTVEAAASALDVSRMTSHWPNTPDFAARPNSLSSCLAESQPTGDIPAPCAAVNPSYASDVARSAVKNELCLFAEDGVRDLIDSTELACIKRLTAFVGQGTGLNQSYTRPSGGDALYGRARVLDTKSAQPAWPSQLQAVFAGCATDLKAKPADAISAYIKTRMMIGMCTPQAKMYNPKDAVTLSNAGASAPLAVEKPSACTCSGTSCP